LKWSSFALTYALAFVFVPYLYESYANEAYYKKSKETKYHKRAIMAAQKAAELKPGDKNVETQLKALGI